MTETRRGVAFGPFRLYASERLLERDGTVVQLGSRALDLLAVLVERAGEVVGKADLLALAWPRMTVDESSLRSQIMGLRKALGDGAPDARYITNVPGRGYCFVAPTTVIGRGRTSDGRNEMASLVPALPRNLSRLFGHDASMAASLAEAHRPENGEALPEQQNLLTESYVATLIEICRKLDSIALAMELAAGRVSKTAAFLSGKQQLEVR